MSSPQRLLPLKPNGDDAIHASSQPEKNIQDGYTVVFGDAQHTRTYYDLHTCLDHRSFLSAYETESIALLRSDIPGHSSRSDNPTSPFDTWPPCVQLQKKNCSSVFASFFQVSLLPWSTIAELVMVASPYHIHVGLLRPSCHFLQHPCTCTSACTPSVAERHVHT